MIFKLIDRLLNPSVCEDLKNIHGDQNHTMTSKNILIEMLDDVRMFQLVYYIICIFVIYMYYE